MPEPGLQFTQNFLVNNLVFVSLPIPQVPTTVVDILKRSTFPPSEKYFRNVHNHIVGNNSCALHSAQKKAESLGYRSFMLSSSIEGLGNDVCQKYMELVKEIVKVRKNRNENLEPNGKKCKLNKIIKNI